MERQLLSRLSSKALDILIRYPFWRKAVQDAYFNPQIPPTSPTVVECFDQSGLLLSRVNGYVKNISVPQQHYSLFLAMYFDGELVFFAVGNEVIVHRLKLFSVFKLVG
ncbi:MULTISPECIES: hypothetical protein [unclassified Coleofasciculus]|uniref:hypothetical protein n=1 Tax=unclassified Coleofasciculus TaxID=2692782 RepID=UPI00187EE959|nr:MULTISPECIES: hypothetical protein [unclassified Coleofasciculus]MBE9128588.1 hypothetical protein [Coleofasciculus sp. LEGE 07081]MBE9150678.1 hypothetical protein [Coleofasciculus sp. LEGE 07092]